MFKMFDNIGNSIKWVAKILYWIAVIAGIICGSFCSTLGIQALFDEYGRDDAVWILFGLLIIALSPIAAWIICAPIYGFGEIIDKLTEIERNTRNGSNLLEVHNQAVEASEINLNTDVVLKKSKKKSSTKRKGITYYCPTCNNKINSDMDQCPKCGQELDWD